jgi:hypothetical protein
LIEYNGEQHYIDKFGKEKFIQQQRNDKMKHEYCNRKNIKLINIPYWEFDNIENILREHKIINKDI